MSSWKSRKEGSILKKRHDRLMLFLALLMMLTVGAVVYTGVSIFNNTTRSYREKIIVNASKLAVTQVDGDSIDKWLNDGPDEQYADTARVLESILDNTPYLQYLYVYQIKEDGCHVVFDFDTSSTELEKYDELPEVAANSLGEVIPFDSSFKEHLPTLLSGGNMDIIESNDTYGWLLTQYEPILDSNGKCVAYVGCDISMLGVNDYVQNYFKRVVVIALLFFIGCILIGVRLSVVARRADEAEILITQRNRDKQLLRELIEAFAKVVDLKDSYTRGHSVRVAVYTKMLAKELGYDDETVEKFYNIALLHDIGKVGIPDSVLNKPGKLTDEEFALIKSHAARGYEVLKNISLMPEIAIGAQAHHERPDGRGYPNGLKGDEIPRVAQILAVADCFDAMYSNRPYRSRMNFDKVVSIIKEVSGTQLTPDVVDAFLRLVEKGEFRAADDHGGGSMETIENIRNEKPENQEDAKKEE
ncbi:MAG: HD-GYP domain-containing protein [Lachnospiraceae bacterium]|nr:HD-GYP domain-containing protein [Lachnospiraceae bacterium]